MKVLVVGGGGREHALCWKIAQSDRVKRIYCAPGNAGTAVEAKTENVDVNAEDIDGLLRFARRARIDLTVVGPEAPLVAGIVDRFEREDLATFGPKARAAELEGSKVFCKNLMRRHGIPTAEYQVFDDAEKARAYATEADTGLVVKADGLAAGKGVTVASTVEETHRAIDRILVEGAFGEAGAQVVLEERLTGEEASILAITGGRSIVILESVQDHKPVGEGDTGPNTGGMGAYTPAPVVTEDVIDRIIGDTIMPIVHAMNREERPYKGVIYAGMMITPAGPKVLEFNCRFGDPELQPILMRYNLDLVDLLEAAVTGTLDRIEPRWDPRPAVCVVMASGGYPGSYAKGKVIEGLGEANADGRVVFHAGTTMKNGAVVTRGGRVLGVTALGEDLAAAVGSAYAGVEAIAFEDAYYRKDIAAKALT